MPEATKRRVVGKMLTTAATVAALMLILGGLLARLLHFTPGPLGVASGIILLVIAVAMVFGNPTASGGGDHPVQNQDPMARPTRILSLTRYTPPPQPSPPAPERHVGV
jgi:small neutral amino acid transporter SnatA (MarC family)